MAETKQKSVRMTLELTAKSRESLEDLSNATDQSFSEVVRRALAVYKFMVQETGEGGSVVIHKPDGTEKEVVFM